MLNLDGVISDEWQTWPIAHVPCLFVQWYTLEGYVTEPVSKLQKAHRAEVNQGKAQTLSTQERGQEGQLVFNSAFLILALLPQALYMYLPPPMFDVNLLNLLTFVCSLFPALNLESDSCSSIARLDLLPTLLLVF